MRRRMLGIALAVLSVLGAGLGTSGTVSPAGAQAPEAEAAPQGGPRRGQPQRPRLRPMIFVHGFVGSGAQFESQSQRLTSNGYPASYIDVLEYDSTFALETREQVFARLDTQITELLEETGADKIDLLGHSLGTSMSQQYLTSSPERAARVAHYANIDGFPAAAPPAGVPTIAIWGENNGALSIAGAENVYLPDQAHVEVATSAETFAEFYEFFTGRPPRTTQVVPEPPNRVRLSGRAVIFPANTGAEGATLQIWEVDGRTGQRRGRSPRATYELGADGAWGPFRADGRKHYEFALIRETTTHHFYPQRYFRSDHLIRLLSSEPGSSIDQLREKSDRHSTINVNRYKEWWGDQGENSDSLTVDDQEVLNAAITPRTKRANVLFVFDAGSDGTTNLAAPIQSVSGLPFITGADVFLPAADPPDDTISVAMTSRTGDGETEVVNVPNWASSGHHISVMFRDYSQRSERFRGYWPGF